MTCWPAVRAQPLDLAGRHVVVSAGGTREYLDPVRFLGNRSSGLQGYALARAAAARGAEVTLVAANVTLPDPAGVKVVRVETTAQLRGRRARRRGRGRRGRDGRGAGRLPARPTSATPRSRRPPTGRRPAIELVQNPDILARARHRPGPARRRWSSASPPRPATTTGSVLDLARAKLARKGCDLLVVNDVSGGAVFGSPDNEAVILGADGGARRGAARVEDRARPRHLGPGARALD